MNYRYSLWQIIFSIITLINLINTSRLSTMEVPTKNESILKAVNQLPPEIQNAIALFEAGEFFFVAQALTKQTSPIQSIATEKNKVEIKFYADKQTYYCKEETWDMDAGSGLYSMQETTIPRFDRPTLIPGIGAGLLLGFGQMPPVQKRTTQKKMHQLLPTSNFGTPKFKTKLRTTQTCMQHMLTVPQAHLIARAYNATKNGHMLTIYYLSEDAKILLTFDKDARIYLLKRLNIQLEMSEFITTIRECVIQ